MDTTTERGHRVYVAVDLRTEEVISISVLEDLAQGRGYVISGHFGPNADGTVILDTADDTWNGRTAREIALRPASQGIGLGWTFTTEEAIDVHRRRPSGSRSRRAHRGRQDQHR